MANLFSVVRLFGAISGLKVNFEKSRVAGINVDSRLIQSVVDLLGCGIETFPMKYLGLPLGGNPRGDMFWNPVVEKIGKRLEKWSRALLSHGGRYTLVTTVLSGILIYFMSLFKITVKVAKSIERLMRDILWEEKDERMKDHLVKWEIVSLPKEKGGLAVGNILARNMALLGKCYQK
ncbi:hypothetical protein CsSME_00050793 [Camellia sinensis var. sinensis]